MNEAIAAVLDAWAAVEKSKPTLRRHLTGVAEGVHHNLAAVLDDLRRVYEEQNRAAVAATELPQRLAELGWTLDATSKPPWKATKVLAGGSTVSRMRHDAEALLEACRLYEV